MRALLAGFGLVAALVLPARAQLVLPGGGSGGGGGGVSSVDIIAGTNVTVSGTCNSSSSINCTINSSGGAGGSPGGANTDVQFNSSSSFGGDSGFTYGGTGQVTVTNSTVNTTPLTVTGHSLTGSNTQSLLSMTGTSNTSGAADVIALHQTCTSCASTNLINLYGGASGTTSEFSVSASGIVSTNNIFQTVNGGGLQISGANQLKMNTNSNVEIEWNNTGPQWIFSVSNLAMSLAANYAMAWGATANTTGTLDTTMCRQAAGIIEFGASTGCAASGSLLLTNITPSGSITNTGIASDTGHTDASVCEDTTSHQFYSGSGTAGICLGTSSERYKHDIASLQEGLPQIMAMQPVQYRLNADHGDPNKVLYGFTAEREAGNLPALTGEDKDGKPNTFDYLGVVPVLVKALQQQQAEIEDLKARLR